MFKVPEHYRSVEDEMRMNKGSDGKKTGDFQNGVVLRKGPAGDMLECIASNGLGWEHVSVRCRRLSFVGKASEQVLRDVKRVPTWEEMCFVKEMFWGEEDVVMQLHPPKSVSMKCQACSLHLWRPGAEAILGGSRIPMPVSLMIGPERAGWAPKVGVFTRLLGWVISLLKGE